MFQAPVQRKTFHQVNLSDALVKCQKSARKSSKIKQNQSWSSTLKGILNVLLQTEWTVQRLGF